jgi:hypothetical protein
MGNEYKLVLKRKQRELRSIKRRCRRDLLREVNVYDQKDVKMYKNLDFHKWKCGNVEDYTKSKSNKNKSKQLTNARKEKIIPILEN